MSKHRRLLYESEESLIYVEDPTPGNKRILKILRPSTPDIDQLLQFNNEYEYTKDLQITGIRKALGKRQEKNQSALELEYIDGITLEKAFLEQERDIEDVMAVFIKIADILGELHETGLIHKDINGHNILWVEAEKQPVIIDFGISSRIDLISTHLGNPDQVKGTLTHMSPEQTGRVNRKVDNRTDLYALGVTLFHVLTGNVPFQSTDALELVHLHIAHRVPLIHHQRADVPEVLSRVVAKLMAKNPEDRYRTAFGLKYDLEKCLTQWQQQKKVHDFVLGEKDYSGKFRIPQKLYGRYSETKTLLKAFHRVSNGGNELLLVAGYSGVGKSALINELYKPITERRGYFVQGKFDQYQRDVPYFAIIQAFNEFCDYLLTEKKETLDQWKSLLLDNLGENGQVLIDMIPALEAIIGSQPEVAQLEISKAQNRLHLVFQNFVRAIAQPEHPFVLFVDDLQWADAASLNLIKLLVTDLRNPYFLVIGAYRDNEVEAGHPLISMLSEATQDEAVISSIQIKPLLEEHIFQLVKDTLQADDFVAQELSELIFSKTQGNAYFTLEFLRSLNQRQLVNYDFHQHVWNIQMEGIRDSSITENVVDLLVTKIQDMPEVTQQALKVASCIGGLFDLQLLSVLYGKSYKETLDDLWTAVAEELLVPVGDQYQYVDVIREHDQLEIEIMFVHDRVQQAAYSLMSSEEKQETHLCIGRLLLDEAPQIKSSLFDVVNHFNKSSSLIQQKEEQTKVASLNLEAAIQARNSSAFQSALTYVDMARTLTSETVWEEAYDFALKLHQTWADIEYLNGNFEKSEELIHRCLEQAKSPAEKSGIYFMLMQNQSNSTRYYEAIDSARQGLKLLNFDFPEENYAPLIPGELEKVVGHFQKYGVASLSDAPAMQDQRMLAIMNILDNLSPPTYVTGETQAWILHVLYKVNLTIHHGITPQGAYAFAELGLIFFIQNNYEYAYPAALLSKTIAEKFHKESPRHLSRTGHLFTNYNLPWVKHIQETVKLNAEYYQVSLDSGELIFAGYTSFWPIYNTYYLGGEPLSSLLVRMSEATEFTKKIKHDLAYDSLVALQMVITHLASPDISTDTFDLPQLTEADFLTHCQNIQDNYGSTMLHLFKAQAYYLQGNMPEALKSLQITEQMAGVLSGNATQDTTYRMYYALTLLALQGQPNTLDENYEVKIDECHQQLMLWASHNASNFEHKQLLIEAEIASSRGDTLQAVEKYQAAIQSAERYDYEREAALTHQRAGIFWLSQNSPLYAKAHLERARYLFDKLGYCRLVANINQSYQYLLSSSSETTSRLTRNTSQAISVTTTTNVGELDTLSIIKAANTLSEEIVLDKLLDKMLQLSIETAGGQRAVLVLQRFATWTMVADLNIERELPSVVTDRPLEDSEDIPVSVINYVIRTQNKVLSHLIGSQNIFSRDAYLNTEKPASFMCLPLTYKGETRGILYLEHQTMTQAFTEERLEVLQLLTSQMAVSLENATLYQYQSELNQAYQRFVPLDFIEALTHRSILQAKLGDHIRQEMTVMFCDIRSYSSMAENMTAKENFNFLNGYLTRVGPIVRQYQGFINHYLGDGFVALFKDHAENALRAATSITEEINQYNLQRVSKRRKPIKVGFGIHTGEVMMGIIGDQDRHDASVISDTVNTSSRLEGLTKTFGANIILSGTTIAQLSNPEYFQFRYLGRIQMKGKEFILEVHEMFSADPTVLLEKKRQTLDDFSQGIREYFDQRFGEAALLLRKVLDANPSDKAASRYLQNSAQMMVKGAPQNWDGVEIMTEK